MNAYMKGPMLGPDSYFHMHWVWRDTPDCATNHHLSYARSKDLIHWESIEGESISLPITLKQTELWVDPIPSGGGILNGHHHIAFGSDHRPILTYHKTDTNGNMQVYVARPEKGKWVRHLLTDWDKPIHFSGRGAMPFIGIQISKLTQNEPGIFSMTYRHRDYGRGVLFVDEQTLSPLAEKAIILNEPYPQKMNQLQIDFKGIDIRRSEDLGSPETEGIRYILQWETLGANYDTMRKGPLPEPGMLKLYKLTL
jgi:hypothetical protein